MCKTDANVALCSVCTEGRTRPQALREVWTKMLDFLTVDLDNVFNGNTNNLNLTLVCCLCASPPLLRDIYKLEEARSMTF